MKKIVIYSDGGARGNPGPSAIGFIIKDSKKTIAECGSFIGVTTNNVAEYEAVKSALQNLIERNLIPVVVTCFLDSELVVKQLNGIYKVKQEHLKIYYNFVSDIVNKLKERGCREVCFKYVPREKNQEADQLVNEALDKVMKVSA
ncbi:MAG: ribonuclease HI family protein [Patescibacteria group bacterium]|jgi:ribonuclease HI